MHALVIKLPLPDIGALAVKGFPGSPLFLLHPLKIAISYHKSVFLSRTYSAIINKTAFPIFVRHSSYYLSSKYRAIALYFDELID